MSVFAKLKLLLDETLKWLKLCVSLLNSWFVLPYDSEGCANNSSESTFECSPFILRRTFCCMYASYVERDVTALGLLLLLHTLIDEWNHSSTVEETKSVQPLATALNWDKKYLQKTQNIVTLIRCCSAYVQCVIALVNLTFWERQSVVLLGTSVYIARNNITISDCLFLP